MAEISKLEEQANLLMNNVSGWEQNVLTLIAKKIKKYKKMSLEDVKAINNIAVVKSDMETITKDLAKITGYNVSQIEQMYGTLLEEQHLANQPLYDFRGKPFKPFAENKELQSLTKAYAKTTGEKMINLAKTKALCVLDRNGKTIGLQKYYTDVLDKAVMQVATASTDFYSAMRSTIKEMGQSGIRIDYGNGITRRLDSAVRQNLLWGAKKASEEYFEEIGNELDCDGIEIDWHTNPRPTHVFMQGKQYVNGKARTINGVYFESSAKALERLNDYGCLHFATPIICGVSVPRYDEKELKKLNKQNEIIYNYNGEDYTGYEITQLQRKLETAIRESKLTEKIAEAAGDTLQENKQKERTKALYDQYEDLCKQTGFNEEKQRIKI